MATFLYRLGRLSFRRRGVVLVLWLVLLGGAGAAAATMSQPTTDTFSLPGTEAQEGFDLIEERVPQANAEGATARVVFAAPEGEQLTASQYRSATGDTVDNLASGPQVASVQGPSEANAVSPDGRVGYAQVQYTEQPSELDQATRDALERADAPAEDAGLRVETGGTVLQPQPEPPATEVVGLAVAAVVLAVTLGSLVAAGLPLLTALIGVGIGLAGVTASTAFFELNSVTSILALMLGLAVAIDYALFIVTRYRHEVSRNPDREHAAGHAVGTAGNAVVFAGATVVIALTALSVANIPILTAMGLAAAATVALAVLIALTLLPALLGFAGTRIGDGRHIEATEAGTGQPGLGERWGRFVTRHRILVLLVAVPALAVLALPATDLRLGMPNDSTAPPESTQRQAYDLLSEGFGPGVNGPLMVTVDLTGMQDPQNRQGTASDLAEEIRGLDNVQRASPPQVVPQGTTALLTVVPTSGPSSQQTEQLVHDIRGLAASFDAETGAKVLVTGQTAMMIDVSEQLSDAMLPYLVVVVGLALLLLALVFRSILVPLQATAGFLLTIGATFGAVVAVFQWGWLDWLFGVEQTAPIVSILPIFMIGVVFGLAMDYQVFLVTRMREDYVHGAPPSEAVVGGFRHGARVVTAAALIMISVFGGFVASDDKMVTSMGLALAFGVLVDAFVVRMAIVPAVMALLGRAAWWLPAWLDRLLPNVDVEGEKLGLGRTSPTPPWRESVGGADAGTPRPEQVRREPVGVATGGAGNAVAQPWTGAANQPLAGLGAGEPAATLAGGPSVRGKVRSARGAAVPNTVLTLIDPQGRQVGRGHAEHGGEYELTVSGPGTYVLIASAETYRPQASTVAVGEHPVDVELVLPSTGSLTGEVTDDLTDSAVAAATVTLADERGEVIGSVQTTPDGRYTVTDLPVGSYTLAVSSEWHRPTAATVTVSDNDRTVHDVRLFRGARVHGVARATVDGRALVDARVTLLDADGTVRGATSTDASGEYRFTDLPEGEYTIVASGYPPATSSLRVTFGDDAEHDVRLGHPDDTSTVS